MMTKMFLLVFCKHTVSQALADLLLRKEKAISRAKEEHQLPALSSVAVLARAAFHHSHEDYQQILTSELVW
jgi:hypothetical protein